MRSILVLSIYLLLLTGHILYAQAPSITYTDPQTYTAGKAITPITPVNSRVAAPGYSSQHVLLDSGLTIPVGVAADAAGNVYVASQGSTNSTGTVRKVPIAGIPVILASGFTDIQGVAVDASGNVYAITYKAVYKIPASGGSTVTLASGLGTLKAIAADASGNLYVGGLSNIIYKIPVGGSPVPFGSGIGLVGTVTGLTVDAGGNVYVAGGFHADPNSSNITQEVRKVPVGGGSPVILDASYNAIGITVDAAGNVYMGNGSSTTVRKILADGSGSVALGSGFNGPTDVAVDAAGNVYVDDYGNEVIKKIPTGGGAPVILDADLGIVSGVAVDAGGNLYVTDNLPNPVRGYHVYKIPADGGRQVTIASGTTLNQPVSVAVDAAGNVYVANYGSGVVKFPGGGGPPVTIGSGFNGPTGVAVDAAGNVYVADQNNNTVKKINAGDGTTITLAAVHSPQGVAVDAFGNVYVTGSGAVSEIPVGSGAAVTLASGLANPKGVAVDAAGDIYVADSNNSTIYKIPAGGGNAVPLGSGLRLPTGIAVDAVGNMFVTDIGNNTLEQIKPVGGYYINTALPAGLSFNGTNGTISGTPTAASPATIYTITAYNSSGSSTATVSITVNAGIAAPAISYAGQQTYTAGTLITPLTPTNSGGAVPATIYGQVSTFAGSGAAGNTNGTGTAASFNSPYAMAADAAGNIYVADYGNNLIRKITPAGIVTTFAGSGARGNTNGTGTAASFSFDGNYGSNGITIDGVGNLYVADADNNEIRKITPAGVVTTFAGSGNPGSNDGVSTVASFSRPSGVAIDATGNVYVADANNSTIRKISPAGVVTTFAGAAGVTGSTNGVGTAATFNIPNAVAVDAAGNVYVVDAFNYNIRKITPTAVVTTLAGGNIAFARGHADGIGTAASFSFPTDIAVDAAGNIYVADNGNNLIRKITPAGVVTTLAGSGAKGHADGTGTAASFNAPTGVAVDAAGNIYVAEALNNLIRKVVSTGYGISPALPTGLSMDDTGAISGTPTVSSPATTYTIAAYNSGGSSTASVSIAVNAVVITFPTFAPVTYGSPDIVPGATSTSTTIPVTYTSSNTAVATITASGNIHVVGAGTAAITALQTGGTATPVVQTLTVTPAALTITAGNQTKTYGADNPALTVSYAGFVNGDDATKLSSPAVVATTAATSSPAGTYPVTASGALSTNYTISYTAGTLTVNPAALTIAANNQTMVYGSAVPTLTANYAGFVNGDDVTKLSSPVVVATTATASSPAGTYPVTVSGAVSANYTFTYTAATLTINPAALTITADNQTKTYGADNPTLTVSYTGFVNGDDATKLSTPPVVTSTASAASAPGTYPVTATGAVSPNYTFTYAAGTLTVTQATLTITADNKTKYYSDPNPALTLSYSGFVNGETQSVLTTQATVSTTAAALSPAGTYPITASGGAAANYSINYVAGTLTVNPAPAPTVTAMSNTAGITGSSINITGTYFLGATAVTFGGTPAASFTVNSATSITAVVGAGASGAIAVTTPGGTGTLAGFTYQLTLPQTNFKLTITSATCKGSSNGSVNITASQALNYVATITGGGLNTPYPFTTSADINNLAAGSYSVCITVTGQAGYQQCFNVDITEPKDLSVYTVVNPADNTLALALSGGTQYNIVLNGSNYTTTQSSITLPLNFGDNDLMVTTDRLCQGTVRKSINLARAIVPYPVPFQTSLNLNLGINNVNHVALEIHNVSDGKLVFSKQYTNQSGVLQLDLSDLKGGVYALHLSMDNFEKIFKIMKK